MPFSKALSELITIHASSIFTFTHTLETYIPPAHKWHVSRVHPHLFIIRNWVICKRDDIVDEGDMGHQHNKWQIMKALYVV